MNTNETPRCLAQCNKGDIDGWIHLAFELEKELNDLKMCYNMLVREREDFIKFTNTLDAPSPKELLVGPIAVAKHVINHLVRSRDLAVEDMKGAMERSESKSQTIKEAWNHINKLITGMLISDERWKSAVNWLNKNRM